jgi:hypothetical protein
MTSPWWKKFVKCTSHRPKTIQSSIRSEKINKWSAYDDTKKNHLFYDHKVLWSQEPIQEMWQYT